jgi:hypothetical protein
MRDEGAQPTPYPVSETFCALPATDSRSAARRKISSQDDIAKATGFVRRHILSGRKRSGCYRAWKTSLNRAGVLAVPLYQVFYEGEEPRRRTRYSAELGEDLGEPFQIGNRRK